MAGKKEENVQIGVRVKKAREAAGLTQERLAELVDVTAQYLSGVERGAVGLSVPVLMRLCSVLLVSCDFILYGNIECTDVTGVTARLSKLPPEHVQNVEEILNRYMEGVAIGEYQDIATATDVTNWLTSYYDAYNFGVDDLSTPSDEALLKVEYNNKKSNSLFLSRVIASKGLTTMKDIRNSIHDNALVTIVKTDYSTEAQRVVGAFPALFPIDTADMGKLNPTEQGEIYYQLNAFEYANCAAVATKIDELVDAKILSTINPSVDGGSYCGGGGGGGGGWAWRLLFRRP